MKRSEINTVIKKFEKLLEEYRFAIPEYLKITPPLLDISAPEFAEIRDNMLGWDVTDYGMGNYDKLGLALITLRNGNVNKPQYRKPYAEKIMMLTEGQISPMHFHWSKMEDIINRGGNDLVFTLYNADEKEELAASPVTVYQDGRVYEIPAGGQVILKPGQSLTLHPRCYHEFAVPENGRGSTLIGEVSMCNDDNNDNRFLKPLGRFPEIEEDEPPYRLLCNEYDKVKQ